MSQRKKPYTESQTNFQLLAFLKPTVFNLIYCLFFGGLEKHLAYEKYLHVQKLFNLYIHIYKILNLFIYKSIKIGYDMIYYLFSSIYNFN